jgi:hypothetical protein
MSPAAAMSEWVRREVALAQSLGKPILPLLLAGGALEYIKDVQYEPVLDRRVTNSPRCSTPTRQSRPVRAHQRRNNATLPA